MKFIDDKGKPKKDESPQEERAYIIQLILHELDNVMAALLQDKLQQMSIQELTDFLEYLYNTKKEEPPVEDDEHIQIIADLNKEVDRLVKRLRHINKELREVKEQLKDATKDKPHCKHDKDPECFYCKVKEQTDAAVKVITKLQKAGYTKAAANQLALAIMMPALGDDANARENN